MIKLVAILAVIAVLVATIIVWDSESPYLGEQPDAPSGVDDPVGPPSFDNFEVTRDALEFADVENDVDYSEALDFLSSIGLISGDVQEDGERLFNGTGTITFEEALSVAVNIHRTYYGYAAPPADVWAYAREHNILPSAYFDESDAGLPVDKTEWAMVFSRALPTEAFESINDIDEVPGLEGDSFGYGSLLSMLRVGIMTPDEIGAGGLFNRSRGFALYLARVISPEMRVAFAPLPEVPDGEIDEYEYAEYDDEN